MGAALPRGLQLAGICAVLLAAAVVAHAVEPAETASMVVGLAKCADCTRKNMKADAAFNGLQVAVKCKNAADGVFETKAVGDVDKSGAFSVPLAADLLREDGELKQDCFAQLHSAAAKQPCPGQDPSWIVRPSTDGDEKTMKQKSKSFVAVAGKVHYPSKVCASVFLCDPFHKKKHLLHKKPIVIPHIHKKPVTPTTPVPVYHSPVPEYKPPHPTPIYHPPADEHKTVQNPETDPEKFKKLLPFIKKNPFFKFPKFPPGKEEIKA